MEITSEQAAETLGVSSAEIRRLLRSGQLAGRKFGDVWMADVEAVHRRKQLSATAGRRWSPRIATAALLQLSEKRADWLSDSELSRLRHRLRETHAQHLVQKTRGLVKELRLRVPASGLDWLAEQSTANRVVAITSESAIELMKFGLLPRTSASKPSTPIHYACTNRDLDLVLSATNAVNADASANLFLHVVGGDDEFHIADVKEILAALLLADSLDVRIRSAATSRLEQTLRTAISKN